MSDNRAWTIGGLPQAGGTTYVRTPDGSILTGINNGGSAGVYVGGKTFFPTH